MTSCVMYTRVSSAEQDKAGYSIPFQRQRIEEYAGKEDYQILERFEDVYSAKQSGRPGFEAMVRFLVDHSSVRCVLVHKLDRLSRNFTDFALVREGLGVRVLPVDEPVDDSPIGDLTQSVGVGVAKYFSGNLSREVKKGMEEKFNSGGYNGKAPFGYRNISRTKTTKARVEVDPESAAIVRHLFERYSEGHLSLKAVSLELFDFGLRTRACKPLSPQQVKDMLLNPFYRGLTRLREETRPGIHDSIISAELGRAVDRILKRRSTDHGEKGTKYFLLRGFLFCGACGKRMTAEDHSRGSYYHCLSDLAGRTCAQPYAPVKQLETLVESLLPSIALTEKGKNEVLCALHDLEVEHDRCREREESSLHQRRDALQAKLTVLTDGYACREVPAEQYRRLRTAYQHELTTVDERLQFLSDNIAADIASIESLLNIATCVASFYNLAVTPEDRKDHLRRIFRRIEITDKGISRIEYNPPFHLLLGTAPERAGRGESLEHALLEFITQEH